MRNKVGTKNQKGIYIILTHIYQIQIIIEISYYVFDTLLYLLIRNCKKINLFDITS